MTKVVKVTNERHHKLRLEAANRDIQISKIVEDALRDREIRLQMEHAQDAVV